MTPFISVDNRAKGTRAAAVVELLTRRIKTPMEDAVVLE